MYLNNYLYDGAGSQAKATLAILQGLLSGNIPEVKLGRWENGREQGYIVYYYNSKIQKQINIAFFEYRKTDDLCAIKWEQTSIDKAITLVNADLPAPYKHSYEVNYGQILKMAKWITKEIKKISERV